MNEQIYECNSCQNKAPFRTETIAQFRRHIAIEHCDGHFSTFRCDQCNGKYYDYPHFEEHTQRSPACLPIKLHEEPLSDRIRQIFDSLTDQMSNKIGNSKSSDQNDEQSDKPIRKCIPSKVESIRHLFMKGQQKWNDDVGSEKRQCRQLSPTKRCLCCEQVTPKKRRAEWAMESVTKKARTTSPSKSSEIKEENNSPVVTKARPVISVHVGEIVWAFIPSSPYWPARVAKIFGDKARVIWFGEQKHSSVKLSDICSFRDNFQRRYRRTLKRPNYHNAIAMAIVAIKQDSSSHGDHCDDYYRHALAPMCWQYLRKLDEEAAAGQPITVPKRGRKRARKTAFPVTKRPTAARKKLANGEQSSVWFVSEIEERKGNEIEFQMDSNVTDQKTATALAIPLVEPLPVETLPASNDTVAELDKWNKGHNGSTSTNRYTKVFQCVYCGWNTGYEILMLRHTEFMHKRRGAASC